MRTINYILLPPVGTGRLERKGTLTDLVRAIPFLLFLDCIPPLDILNQVLQTGRSEAGMSGGAEWEPFQITLEEHKFLVADLQTSPDRDFYFVEPPDDINQHEQWWRWVLMQHKEKKSHI